jgi:hypothetical protein
LIPDRVLYVVAVNETQLVTNSLCFGVRTRGPWFVAWDRMITPDVGRAWKWTTFAEALMAVEKWPLRDAGVACVLPSALEAAEAAAIAELEARAESP